MTTIADFLESLGSQSLETLWLPLLAWTFFWLVMEGLLRLRPGLHPTTRYRAYQAILMCLPIGLIVATLADAAAVFAQAPVLITFEMPIVVSAATPEMHADLISDTGLQVTLPLVLGAATVLAALAATVQLGRLAINSFALHRYRRSITSDDATSRRSVVTVGRRAISVIETNRATVPMTFGLRRPMIVIPSSLDTHDRRLALAHEMVHVRQRDYLAQWLESFVAAVFAIHPGVHLLRRRCDLFREMACDASLLVAPDINRRSYADLLFRLVHPPATLKAGSVSMADSTPHLHKRLRAMKSYSTASHVNPIRSAWTAALCIVMIGAGVLVVPQVVAQRVDAPPPPVEPPPPPPFSVAHFQGQHVILDGEPYEGDLNLIDATRIRSIDVLKGERAIAAYGDLGRNGAIRITTGDAPPPPPAAANPPADTSETFVVVESMPELIGGLASIQQQIRYPEEAREAGVEGRVFVQFVVDEEGTVAEVDITRGVGYGLDEEALRVVRNARFEPGTQRGEPVRVQMAVPISFKLGTEGASAQTAADELPTSFAVTGAHPNPFNRTATVTFDLPDRAVVGVEIFDMTGRRVLSVPESEFAAGAGHAVSVDGSSLASGSYVYRVTAQLDGGTQTASGNLTLVK